jgi:ABC-type polar amino acid transport system ATPase subunit
LPAVDEVTSFLTADVFVNETRVTCGIVSHDAELAEAVVSNITQASEGQHSSPAEKGISNLH